MTRARTRQNQEYAAQVTNAFGKSHRRTAREKQQGVDITPHVAGRIVFAKCLKGENMNAMVLEAVARELVEIS